MDPIGINLSSLLENQQSVPSISFQPSFYDRIQNNCSLSDAAVTPGFLPGSGFDMLMNNIASFKDFISVAQDGLSKMRSEGEGIRDLLAQAREEGVTPELLDKVQEEVQARLGAIQRIRGGADFYGINPFDKAFSLEIPNVLELMNAKNKQEASGEIANMLASVDVDIKIEGDGFSFGGSAKIEIGYTEEGALQINVDASMDFDLSGLLDKGVSSDEAWDMINEFLDMLGVQEGDMGDAQNFMDAVFEKMFNLLTGNSDGADGLEFEPDSSNVLKGKIMQQASITLDGVAGQAPSIAINIL